jgi:hypothetical protein
MDMEVLRRKLERTTDDYGFNTVLGRLPVPIERNEAE